MRHPTKNYSKTIISKVKGFRSAWNNNDLGVLHSYFSKDVVCKHPIVKIGLLSMLSGSYNGRFEVLKFCGHIFNEFDAFVEKVEIQKIEIVDESYKVFCTGHYPKMKVSGEFFVLYCTDFLMQRVEFTRLMNYRAEAKISRFSLVLKYLQNKK